MEQTVKKFMGPMIDDFYVPLDHQYQQNLAEWAVKCAMCNDTVGVHTRRFFTEAECSAFRQKRTIPDRTQVFAAQFIGRGLDSNGADFVLTEPGTGSLLARGYVYNVLVGHVVLQMLSWRPEAQHADKKVQIKPVSGPWDKLTIQIWPIVEKSVDWPPEMSLTAHVGVTHYGHFRERFKNGTGHRLVTLKSNSTRSR